MESDPCTVCGGTETKLIDGFYYCIECGTQDVKIQETVVEQIIQHDGTFAHASTKKIKTILKDSIQMSDEWRKWHALNFIMLGLVKELMALGASSGFKDRVLWIWTKYMNEFMKKDQMGPISEDVNKSIFDDVEEDYNQQKYKKHKKENNEPQGNIKALRKNIKAFTVNELLAILYLGLLFDRSPIQLSHLIRFINEKRLSLKSWRKFVPKELDVSSIPMGANFKLSTSRFTGVALNCIRETAMFILKVLDLDMPAFPDSRKIVENIVTELCLPNHFKDLVFALMVLYPYHRVENCKARAVDTRRIPNYEADIMGYVLVALKMCFGLDDDYEIKISDAVEKINDEENRLKSYKLGMHSDSTNRLFSFREWSSYLEYRKIMLCKNYLPMAGQHNVEIDDYVFMEHLEKQEKSKKPIKLGDEITMDILNKISSQNEGQVIPKSEFVASLTPSSSYTEVLTRYIQDPEIKLLLSEDFTQYSLTYACKHLKLDVNGENIVKGVTKENKIYNKYIEGTLQKEHCDKTMVYVRNCENKNWVKTNPPTIKHITRISEDGEGNANGYDSNSENHVNNTTVAGEGESHVGNINDITAADEEESVLDIITNTTFADKENPSPFEDIMEEIENMSIFDDSFNDVDNKYDNEQNNEDTISFWTQVRSAVEDDDEPQQSINDKTSLVEAIYNPETFDRASAIKELILHACKKYKITIPKDFNPNPKPTVKRPRDKTKHGDETKPKKKKSHASERQLYMEKILSTYQASIEKDLLSKVSEHVNSFNFVNMIEHNNERIQENQIIDLCANVSDDDMITDDNLHKSQDLKNETPSMNLNSNLEEHGMEEIFDEDSPKTNINFDEKTHDIKQLYVKCKGILHFEDILDIHDPEIDRVLEKKVMEFRNKDPTKDVTERDDASSDVSCDAVCRYTNKKQFNNPADFPKLILNTDKIREFGYWFRRYVWYAKVVGNAERKELFDLELKANVPKSFLFIINQCASIILSSAFAIYKTMMNLETKIARIRVLSDRKRKEKKGIERKKRKGTEKKGKGRKGQEKARKAISVSLSATH